MKYPEEEFDGKQILVPYGWAQSAVDLISQGVWRVDYSPEHKTYVASFHKVRKKMLEDAQELPKQFVGRMANPRWHWELKGPVHESLL